MIQRLCLFVQFHKLPLNMCHPSAICRNISFYYFKRNSTGVHANSFILALGNNSGLRRLQCGLRDYGFIVRKYNSESFGDRLGRMNRSIATGFNYTISCIVVMAGVTYATAPLYKMFCQATGYGGTPKTKFRDKDVGEELANMAKVEDRPLRVKFEAQVNRALEKKWSFKPQQDSVNVVPGDTALAFFTAINHTDNPIIGISTYNVLPYTAGQYFNKIQCFCFEEQRLNPHEEVDMPVFFFIDPEIDDDPSLEKVDELVLSYTFFESKSGEAPQTFLHVRSNRTTT